MSCDVDIQEPSFTEGSSLEVVDKFKSLMLASLSDDSIYNKSKETFAHLFKDLDITEQEKATITAQNITSMVTSITDKAMATALQWATEERDGAAKLALLKAQAHKTTAEVELIESEICSKDADTCYKEAQAIAVSSKSIRENGRVLTKDGCVVTSLEDKGVLYESMMQTNATSYSILAKTYREYGVVDIMNESNADDSSGSFIKGYALETHTTRKNGYGHDNYNSGFEAGYVNMQALVAERQRLGFEDNKLQHSTNSSATMVGQLIGSQDIIDYGEDGIQTYLDLWVDAMNRLNTRANCIDGCNNSESTPPTEP